MICVHGKYKITEKHITNRDQHLLPIMVAAKMVSLTLIHMLVIYMIPNKNKSLIGHSSVCIPL